MTTAPRFVDFFRVATGNAPYSWQGRLACGESFDEEDPATQVPQVACASRLIDIPTGLGKTAGVILAWLFQSSH